MLRARLLRCSPWTPIGAASSTGRPGRAGTAGPLERHVVALAFDEVSFIAGVRLPVDGGQTAR